MSAINLIKPYKLNVGDKVAVVSPSWAGASVFPERYAAGKKQLEKANGIMIGRGANLPENEMDRYDQAFIQVIQKECHLSIPVISQMDFGHTDPMFLLPYGAQAEIDADDGTLTISESAVI